MPLVSVRKLEHLLGHSRDRLTALANEAATHYRPFDLRRLGTSKWRHIDNPQGDLKVVQRRINQRVLRGVSMPETMFGGVPGRSAQMAAAIHAGQELIACLDIRDFFPSTSHDRVHDVFLGLIQCSPRIAHLLTKLTTYNYRLPQGAPTSTTLANLVLLDLHRDITTLTTDRQLRLSFFVDDITVSGPATVVRSTVEPIIQLIQHHRYAISHRKVRLMKRGRPQQVLGVEVGRRTVSYGRRRLSVLRERLRATPPGANLPGPVWRGILSYVDYLAPSQAGSLTRLLQRLNLNFDDTVVPRDVRARETRECCCPLRVRGGVPR
jgi:hypothetical protein